MTIRRFYRGAAAMAAEGGFAVGLDGRPMRTPAGATFVVPTRALAAAIAGEWEAVPEKGEIRPLAMPLTRLAATVLDRVAPRRAAVIDDIVAYARTDLLCYRATEPVELVARQGHAWDPMLDWACGQVGGALVVTAGVIPVDQPAEVIEAYRAAVAAQDDMRLSALFHLTAATGSLVLGLAAVSGRLDPLEALDLAELDTRWQIEHWGEDSEAAIQRANLRRDVEAVATFLRLLEARD